MAEKLWGGRFKKKIDMDFDEFQKSIYYDYKLAEYDLYHSLIHINALAAAGILTLKETKKLHSALMQILEEVEKGSFVPNSDYEDIHTDIHHRVERKVGKLAFKLHSLRSRNDQVVFDEKWYCLEESLKIRGLIIGLIGSLKSSMDKDSKQPFIGYTHTQRAQVIRFNDYLEAYQFMFYRDWSRMRGFYDNLFAYLGAGAIIGSSLKRDYYDKAILGFLKIKAKLSKKVKTVESPMDSVSDRDFIIEFLSILSIIQMHLSRMAEDFILYSTAEFSLIDLPEEFCTGSSLMPHKKNPDFLELVRGYTGRAYGNLVSILTTLKGLPLSYNRDMQLDKEPLFSSVELIEDELRIMAKFIKGVRLNKEKVLQALNDESLYATELADFLVYKGVPFHKAHRIVGRLIRYAQSKDRKIKELPDSLLNAFHKELNQENVKMVMNPEYAISSKKTAFTGSPERKLNEQCA